MERCVCCGAIIPEGTQVCMMCEMEVQERDDSNHRDDQRLRDRAVRGGLPDHPRQDAVEQEEG